MTEENKDITHLLPAGYKGPLKRLLISPAAYAQLAGKSEEIGCDDPQELLKASVTSAASFSSSAYFAYSKWFQRQPKHPFVAALVKEDEALPHRIVLVLDPKAELIESESEVSLPGDYADKRVLEETRVEYFSPAADQP